MAVGFPLEYGGGFGGIQERDSDGNDVRMNTGMMWFGCMRVSEQPPYLYLHNESGEGM